MEFDEWIGIIMECTCTYMRPSRRFQKADISKVPTVPSRGQYWPVNRREEFKPSLSEGKVCATASMYIHMINVHTKLVHKAVCGLTSPYNTCIITSRLCDRG